MGHTHALAGGLGWLAFAPAVLPPAVVVLATPIAMVAALGPDVDHPRSLLGKALGPLGWLVRAVTSHRVETHSLLSVLLIYGALRALGPSAVAGAVAGGWASHIVTDCLTVEGVALWWPITRRKVSLGRISTNGASEAVFSCILCFCFGLYVLWRLTG